MLFKKWVKYYFRFGRRDRTGILILTLLILAVYAAPYFLVKNSASGPIPSHVLASAIDSLSAAEKKLENNPGYRRNEHTGTGGRLFPFDPNTLPATGWRQLGLSEKTTATILKYRDKGGRFRKPEDLQKIWGLPPGFYERVKDYIAIPETVRQQQNERPVFRQNVERKPLVVAINEADTSAFIAMPGIGSKLAGRIVAFREKLGGFYSVEQLREIYGLQDSTFQKIRPYLQEGGTVKKFDLNTVTKEELKAHPYFKWKLANAIVEYRNQHGRFKSQEELKNIAVVDAVTFEKIVHYLSL